MSAPRFFEWVRVLRYVGTREALDRAIEGRGVKGSAPRHWSQGEVRIYEALLSEVPQPLPTTHLRELIKRKLEEAETRHFDYGTEKQAYIRALNDVLEELEL